MLAPEEEEESTSNWSIQGGKEDLCVLAKALNGPALLREKKKEEAQKKTFRWEQGNEYINLTSVWPFWALQSGQHRPEGAEYRAMLAVLL